MKVSFISVMSGCAWGGSELLWSGAARNLLERNIQVQISLKMWVENEMRVRSLRKAGAVVEERFESDGGRGSLKKLAAMIRRRSARRASWRSLLSFGPDLVCISHGNFQCGLEWMERCKLRGIPYVSISQANGEHLWPEDDRADRIYSAHAGARSSCFVSAGNLRLLEAQLGRRLKNGRVIFNPCQVSRSLTTSWPEDTTLKLACVGRLDAAAKGQDLVIGALARPEWRDRKVSVSFFGDGPNARTLRRYAETLGVTERVSFRGHVANVVDIWNEHHALILPSRYEGLPLAVVEAMLCARVPIVTDVAGNRELLEDGESGFIAAAPTPELFGQTLERAWRRRADWQEIGKRARNAALAKVPEDPVHEFAEHLVQIGETHDAENPRNREIGNQ